MARLAALGRVHSDGSRRRPVASAGNSIPVSAPNPKSRSTAYCSSGVSRAANLAMAMLLETRIASAMVSDGCGSSSVIVRPSTRHFPPSPETRSVGDTRRSESNAAAAKIFARDPGSNVSVNALGRALPSRWREARASTSPVPGSSITTSPPCDLLQLRVEREHHVEPRHRWGDHPRRRLVFASRAVLQHDRRTRAARQQAVEGALEPGCAQAVVPQPADGRPRDGGIGIEPVEHRLEMHAPYTPQGLHLERT